MMARRSRHDAAAAIAMRGRDRRHLRDARQAGPGIHEVARASRAESKAMSQPPSELEINRRRDAIDALDRELLRLLNERAAHAKIIGTLKGDTAAYRPEREAQVLRTMRAENPGPLPDGAVTSVFRQIMSACLALEQQLRISYLGPAGTFSHAAVTKHFGDLVDTEPCAAIYGLDILAAHIEDEPNNTTRFWVLGRHGAAPSGRDETSLVMSAHNRPGAVHALLEPLAKHGVSMSRFESRPARTGLWEYLFFVDLEGHQEEGPVAAALSELRERAPFLKLLGSYPAAVS